MARTDSIHAVARAPRAPRQLPRVLLWSAAYVPLYVFLDWMSYVHPVLPLGITPWNPTAGLTLFLLFKLGVRVAPAIFVAALAADIVVRGGPAPLVALLASDALIAGVYAGGGFLLRRRLGASSALDSAEALTAFLLILVPASLVVAAGYVGLYTWLGFVNADDLLSNIARYWIGDLNGALVMMPALLVLSAPRTAARVGQDVGRLELMLQGGAIVGALGAVFALAQNYEIRFSSLLFLPLVWVAMRHGVRGASLALVALQFGLIVVVQASGYQTATFIQLQFLMITLAVMGLMLGVAVTQRRVTEDALQEKQAALNRALQLAAAGEMTSALAHELNQPIAALGGYLGACEILIKDPTPERSARLAETMGKAAAEARRASEVVRRLRDFYRSGVVNARSVAPADIISSSVQVVRARAERSRIRILVEGDEHLPRIRVDPMQLETVLLNLLSNAIDSLAASDAVDRLITVQGLALPSRVCIRVADTGPGVPPDVRGRLFEPFTTTKKDGMGMGLAMSRSLVEANQGTIILEHTRAGASFAVSLPVARP